MEKALADHGIEQEQKLLSKSVVFVAQTHLDSLKIQYIDLVAAMVHNAGFVSTLINVLTAIIYCCRIWSCAKLVMAL